MKQIIKSADDMKVHSRHPYKIPKLTHHVSLANESGFTLIELLISVILGILVTAAAVSILVTSASSSRVQQGSSSIQDDIVFSLSHMQKHIRRANRGAVGDDNKTGSFMSSTTAQGGIVLTAPDDTKYDSDLEDTNLQFAKYGSTKVDKKILTQANHSASNVEGGVIKNDQLTIQYQAPIAGMFDCQGREIPLNNYAIERYFVRDNNGSKALVCASTNYERVKVADEADFITDLSKYETVPAAASLAARPVSLLDSDTGGTVVLSNVDYFHVMLGVTTQSNFATKPETLEMKYINIPTATQILSDDFKQLRIIDIKIGLILRSANSVNTGIKAEDQTFNVLNKTGLKVKATGSPYMRDVYETTILFRNARGKD